MLYLRFGKSLFISMFEKYYDINKKDKFEKLFGDLLGENKLPMENMSAEMVVAHINMLSKINNKKVFVLIDEYVL
ncbi:AAA family ATPase [Clostridium botulinum]|uniref:AAA family ATPase n=1 Tax=Clostridium botulinum TaxID=1491 RepID=UPI001749A39E|nr:AAA family ATPase [Clostridium botulinum]MBD5643950.1 AAA family ATPase [Clostridium botulinum]